MGARRQWTVTALLLLALQIVFLFWLELAFGLNGLLHEALLNGALIALAALGALMPSEMGASRGVLVTVLGFGWFYQHFLAAGLSAGSGAGLSTFAGALVAPIYFGIRRLFLSAPKDRKESVPPDRLTHPSRMAKAFEAVTPASTAVQESL